MNAIRIIKPQSESVGMFVGDAVTTTPYACEPGQPFASTAVMTKLNAPGDVGVPVIAPVKELSDNPGGSAPEDTE